MAIASATAGISSTFTISSVFAAAQGTVTITNPGRAFRILGVTGTGTAASLITVRKNTSGGVTAAVVTTDVTGEPLWGVLTTANVEFLYSDNVHITVATQNATQVDILCVATAGGEALTTAVT
jgi:hypothetical protein